MNEQNTFVSRILDRLAHEELEMKKLGMPNHAAGIRVAIVQVLKLRDETPAQLPDTPGVVAS